MRSIPTEVGGIDASGCAGWQGEIVTAYREPWDKPQPFQVYEVRLTSPTGRVIYRPVTENWLDAAAVDGKAP